MEKQRWEYRTIIIAYDDKTRKGWVDKSRRTSSVVGFEEILAWYAADGWELMSLNPERLRAVPGFGQWHIETRSHRATLKRRRENLDQPDTQKG